MDPNTIEIAVLAFVAGFVLFRLYVTLGRRTGAEPRVPRPQPAQGPVSANIGGQIAPAGPASSAGLEGVAQIVRADPTFDTQHFLSGARAAYELIVGAFAKGDRETLRPLLTPRVFDAYATAITQREAAGGLGPEVVRLRTADLADASLQGDIARVSVKFEAELAEGVHGVRDAHEKWTFERKVRSSDPNWRLASVTAA